MVVASVGDMLGFLKGFIANYVVRNVKKAVPAFYNLPDAIPFRSALSAGQSMTLKKAECGPEDLAFLQYTGGTTGWPGRDAGTRQYHWRRAGLEAWI